MMHTSPSGATRRRSVLVAASALGVATALVGAGVATAAVVTATGPDTQTSARSATFADAGNAPKVLLMEGFENGVSTTPILLDKYVGVDGATYTADPAWISAAQCNGIITSAASTDIAECNANDKLKALANSLGQVGGTDADTNHVVSAFTSSQDVPKDAAQVESVQPFSLGEKGRFVSFGVSAAAAACVGYNHPLLDFSLVDGSQEHAVSDKPIDPCTDPGSKEYVVAGQTLQAGKFISKGGVLFSGDTLRWVMRNAQPSYSGNDGAIDDVVVYDSTPTLAASFAGSPIVGDTARLTLTVQNTSDNGAKPGWSFTEQLPKGLTLASTPNMQTTCQSPEVTAAGGASTLTAKGDLAYGDTSCTISVDVASTTAGTYTIDDATVTAHEGVDLPAAADVVFAPERNELATTDKAVLTGGNDDGIADVGEQIAFTYTVTNNGNVAVHDLDLTSDNGAVTCDTADLAVGASTTCTTSPRAVTQADVDAGSVTDAVAVAAKSRLDASVTTESTATVATTAADAAAGLDIAPVVVATENPGVGDTVSLQVVVKNSGTVTLTDPAVVIAGDTGMTVECAAESIAPGKTITCDVTGSYTVSQADVDAGSIAFAATATSKDPKGATVTAQATTKQDTVAARAAITTKITAKSATGKGDLPAVGDIVTITATVQNSGNVTLHDVASTLTGTDGTCPDTTLLPGTTMTCVVGSHTLTQADIDAGSTDFGISASGTAPAGTVVTGKDSASVTLEQQAAVTTALGVALQGEQDMPLAGQAVTLSATVTNTGNVTVSDIAATLTAPAGGAVVCPTEPLAPGATVTCRIAEYHLSQADVDAGKFAATIAVTGTDPNAVAVTADATSGIDIAQHAEIETQLAAHLSDSEHALPVADDTVELAATITNTGNQTISDVAAVLSGRTGLEITCPDTEIAPGETVDCTIVDYTLTQDDVDGGSVEIALDVTGTDPSGADVDASDERTVGLGAGAGLDLQADHVAEGGGTVLHPGDAITSSYEVANTGNLTVSVLTIDAVRAGAATCELVELAPGDVTECTSDAVYTVTADDAKAGSVTFTAVARGDAPRADATTPIEGAEPAETTSVRTVVAMTGTAAAAPVQVVSNEVSATFDTAEVPAPVELAFTGTEVLAIALPIAIVLLLAALVLFMLVRRRANQRNSGSATE